GGRLRPAPLYWLRRPQPQTRMQKVSYDAVREEWGRSRPLFIVHFFVWWLRPFQRTASEPACALEALKTFSPRLQTTRRNRDKLLPNTSLTSSRWRRVGPKPVTRCSRRRCWLRRSTCTSVTRARAQIRRL